MASIVDRAYNFGVTEGQNGEALLTMSQVLRYLIPTNARERSMSSFVRRATIRAFDRGYTAGRNSRQNA